MKRIIVLIFIVFSVSALRAQWVNIGTLTGTGTTYPSISAVDDNVLWAAGGNGGTPVIWRSTNAGVNFTSITPPPCFEITCLYGVSAVECFVGDGGSTGAAGGNAKFFRTTNAGANWILINQTGGTGGFFIDAVFSKVNPTNGIAVSKPPNGTGQPFYLLKTIDGGSNWTVEAPPAVSGGTAIWHCGIIYDASAYGFGATGGFLPQVRGTTDGGATWSLFPVLIGLGTLSSFAYSDVSSVALAATTSIVARTTDQGTSWVTVDNGGALSMKWVYGSGTCYLMTGTVIKKSIDNGATFSSMTVPGASGLKHFDFAYTGGNVFGYAITSAGVVYKLSEPLTGIQTTGGEIPKDFSLQQNYPNPFNPTTKIGFSIPTPLNPPFQKGGKERSSGGLVKLIVFDINGREVETLVNEQLNPGTYEISFDASKYSSGTYFYRLTAGDFTETKKMILIK